MLLSALEDGVPTVIKSRNGGVVDIADQARSEGQAAGADFDVLNAMTICDGGAQITTATTTTVENGPCVLSGIQILAAVASTITIYNNTAGSGTIIATLPANLAVGYYPFNRLCSVGLTIVTAGASNMLVHTRKASA
jgi:hypothetical protein